MSIKKTTKPTHKPLALYKNGQKVWTISYHRGKPDQLLEGVIKRVNSAEYVPEDELGKAKSPIISFSYKVATSPFWLDLMEAELYPNFVEAAKVFAKHFVVLVK